MVFFTSFRDFAHKFLMGSYVVGITLVSYGFLCSDVDSKGLNGTISRALFQKVPNFVKFYSKQLLGEFVGVELELCVLVDCWSTKSSLLSCR